MREQPRGVRLVMVCRAGWVAGKLRKNNNYSKRKSGGSSRAVAVHQDVRREGSATSPVDAKDSRCSPSHPAISAVRYSWAYRLLAVALLVGFLQKLRCGYAEPVRKLP